MDRERHRQLKEIFTAAVELPTSELDEFLRQRCRGDGELEAELRELLALDREDDGFLERPAVQDLGIGPPDAAHADLRDAEIAGPPVGDWDRYSELELVASGGMGEVYRAFDPRLKRLTALKFLRGSNRKQVERFLREAEAQARVEHDNVLEVYETGEVEGQRYIAMRYVDGPTLGQTREETTLDDKIRIMGQVAEAVHAAHREGLVHRDLKPSNILMERSADGRYKPFVMDFGIATSLEGPGLTTTGDLLGTPWYMAPERVSWGPAKADRRSDVYSLGVTFFEYLCGERPFTTESPLEMLSLLKDGEPQRLRTVDPSLPADLETIVMKCLERDPNRRYSSARALAEDLQRYLAGEPISARPATVTYRLMKRIRRHRGMVILAAVACLALLAMLLLNLRSSHEGQRRERLARDFAHRVQEIDNLMRMARVAPLHDVSAEEAMARAKMDQIRDRVTQVGEAGEGSGHYALGRGYQALGELRRAREHLERAWNRGYRSPEVAFALGEVLGELYREQLTDVERIADETTRRQRRADLDRDLREPALEYLRASGGLGGESPEYTRAITAFIQDRLELALEQAREAHARLPWLYEAHKLEGDILTASGLSAWHRGASEEALRSWRQAMDAYANATRVARSDFDGWLRLCDLSRSLLELHQSEGLTLPVDTYEQGREACSNAITSKPLEPEGHRLLSAVQCLRAEALMSEGGDPRRSLDAALASAEQAVALERRPLRSELALGNALLAEARHHRLEGEEARPWIERSVAAFKRALEVDESFAPAHGRLGVARLEAAEIDLAEGADPRQNLVLSIAALADATTIAWDDIHAHLTHGQAQLRMARYLMNHGGDPELSLERAVDAFDHSLAINPDYVRGQLGRAEALTTTAQWRARGDNDAREVAAEAELACRRVLELEPEGHEAARAHILLDTLQSLAAP